MVLIACALILCEAMARLGVGPLRLWRSARLNPLEEFGIGLLFGWSFLGLTFLGLAMTGLFYTAALLAAMGFMIVLSIPCSPPALLTVSALLSARKQMGVPALIALAAAAIPLLGFLFSPVTHIDAYMYHLGAPWQYFQSHRVLFDHIPMLFHVPGLTDMGFTLSFILKDDRLAHWIVASFFMAASAVYAGRALQRGQRVAAWLGPMLAMGSLHVVSLLSVAKSDLPASALLVTGAIVQGPTSWFLAAVLFGFGLSAKLAYAPFVLIWWVFHRPPARHLGWVALLLVAPSLPWWIKSMLATGNPLYPFGWKFIPSLGWGSMNESANLIYQQPLWASDTLHLIDVPWATFAHLSHEQILLALFLPALLLWSSRRRAFIACVVSVGAILAIGHYPRFALPCFWLMCLLAGLEAGTFSVVNRKLFVCAMLGFTLLRCDSLPFLERHSWREMFVAPVVKLKAVFSTFRTVRDHLTALSPSRVITVADIRVYGLPGRVIYTGGLGETPLFWKLAHESENGRVFSKKIKQLGARVLVHNFVSKEWIARRYQWFTWDSRALALYVDYCKQYLSVLIPPDRCDGDNGGFYVYRIHSASLSPAPEHTFFVPGAGWASHSAKVYRDTGRMQEAITEYGKLLRVAPGVGQFVNELAAGYAVAKNWAVAFRLFKPFIGYGMIDAINVPGYGEAAVNLGRLDVAEAALTKCLSLYPGRRMPNGLNLAIVYLERARRQLADDHLSKVDHYLDRAVAVLSVTFMQTNEKHVVQYRRETLAEVIGLRGELALRRGQQEKASRFYREALKLAPGVAEAKRWIQPE